MCGRFETTPTAESLVNALKKQKVDLLIEIESEKRKTENIYECNTRLDLDYLFPGNDAKKKAC